MTYIDKRVNNDELVELLRTDYSQAFKLWKKGVNFFASDFYRNEYAPMLSIPTDTVIEYDYSNHCDHDRVYLNGLAHVMNALPSWSEYPKKRNSLHITAAYYETITSHNRYYVLFKNDSNIGVAKDYDSIESFTKVKNNYHFGTGGGLVHILAFLLECDENMKNKTPLEESGRKYIEKFINIDVKTACETIDNLIATSESDLNHNLIYNEPHIDSLTVEMSLALIDCIKQFDSTFDMLNQLLDPKINEFKLTKTKKINEFRSKGYVTHELWTDSEVLLIPMTKIKDSESNYRKNEYEDLLNNIDI